MRLSNLLSCALTLAALAPMLALAPASADDTPEAAASAASIKFKDMSIDFGAVDHGVTVIEKFHYTNEGTAPLEILSVKASCGCSAAIPDKKVIGPKEESAIEVKFHTNKKRINQTEQRFTNRFTVTTNDPEHRSIILKLVGTVRSRYRLAPAGGAIVKLDPGAAAPKTATVRIYPRPGAEASLIGAKVKSKPNEVEVTSIEPVKQGEKVIALDIAVAPSLTAPAGRIRGQILLTMAKDYPEASIPVSGEILATVRGRPARITVMVTPRTKVPTIQIQAVNSGVKIVKALVVPDMAGPAAFSLAEAEGTAIDSEVTITPTASVEVAKLPSQTGEFVFYLTDAETPVLRIPYAIRNSASDNDVRAKATTAGVRLSSYSLTPSSLAPGRTQIMAFSVTALPEQTVDLYDLSVEGSSEVTATSKPVQGAKTGRVDVRVSPRKVGAIDAVIRFRPRKDADFLTVPLRGAVKSAFRLAPEGVYLTARRRAASVVISRSPGSAPKVTSATDPEGHVTVVHEVQGQTLHLRIVASEGAKPGPFFTEVEVQLEGGTENTIRIPVFGEL